MTKEVSSNDYEVDILRTLDGRDVIGISAGAAMWAAAASLKQKGYACGSYDITEKGKDKLSELRKEGKIP